MRNGTTLIELVVALAILSALTVVGAPRLSALRDRVEVRAAREELVGLFTAARVTAVTRGGASFRVEADPPAARVIVDGVVVRSRRIGEPARPLVVALPAGRSAVELPFDGLGLGRFASATIVVRRGSAEAGLVVSSYGRVRRQ